MIVRENLWYNPSSCHLFLIRTILSASPQNFYIAFYHIKNPRSRKLERNNKTNISSITEEMFVCPQPFAAPAVIPFTKYFWNIQNIASAGTMEITVPAKTISHLAEYCPTNPAISTVIVFALPLGSAK